MMKKILSIIFFSSLFITNTFSQEESTNWIFAKNSKLNFSNNSTNFSNSGELTSTDDEVASISDEVGNLLFYTDGKSVWNRNNNIMQNGDNSLAHTTLASYIYNPKEPVIILPIPNSNKYYIFTEKVTLYDSTLGFWSNHYFSIVDMDQNNGLGNVTSLNNFLISSFDIDSSGYIQHHNVTTAVHSDGVSYWLILKPNQDFYAFHITSAVLQASPTYIKSSVNCNQLQAKTSCNSFSKELSLKTSSNSRQLASIINSSGNCLGGSFVKVYNFNNSIGIIENCQESFSDSLEYVSLDFSEDGNYVYILKNYVNQELIVFDISNLSSIHKKFTLISTNPNTIPLGNSIQRAIDSKIYFVNKFSTQYLWEVSDPNNPLTTSVIQTNYFNTNEFGSFPRLVPFDDCTKIFYTDAVIDNTTFNKSVQDDIYASNHIKNSSDVAYDAGSRIILKPGFKIESGSLFRGFIEGCSNISAKVSTSKKVKQGELKATIIYPNPSSGVFYLSTKNIITNYKVVNQIGKTVLSNKTTSNNFQVDLQKYSSGIYFIQLQFENGDVEMKKIIKK